MLNKVGIERQWSLEVCFIRIKCVLKIFTTFWRIIPMRTFDVIVHSTIAAVHCIHILFNI